MSYFDFINTIAFSRVSGSIEENRCGKIIYNEALRLGLKTSLMSFPVSSYYRGKSFLEINNKKYSGISLGNSLSTDELGIEGEIVFLETFDAARMINVKDKICMIPNRFVDFKYYMYLINNNAKGLVFCDGSIVDSDSSVDDIDVYNFKERYYKFGDIPALCIRTVDFNEIINILPRSGRLVSIISNEVGASYNIISEITGNKYPDEIIVISAHYDSVRNSVGAYDNGSGVAALFEISKFFLKNTPKRTIKFIWCGSEEAGLLGSKAFLKENELELYKYVLNINIDMLGVTIGSNKAFVIGDNALASFLDYYSKIEGYPLDVNNTIFKSDSIMFADKEIPSVSFTRFSSINGLEIHSRRDVIGFLDERTFINNVIFIVKFTEYIANAALFPVEKYIPLRLKEDLDIFIGRKKK